MHPLPLRRQRIRAGRLHSLALAGAIPVLLAGAAASAQPTVEARLRALEARVSALEGRAGPASAAAATSAAIDCKVFDIRSNGVAQQRLGITSNGRVIGSYQGSAAPYLTSLLRPGVNNVVFAYDSPGDGKTLLQVYCIPPGAEDRVEIRRFTPQAGSLEERVTVNLTPSDR